MDMEKFIEQKNAEAEQVIADVDAAVQELKNKIIETLQKRDTAIAKIRAERDAAMLKEKTKDYPKELVQNHVICSICGGQMRPFTIMENDKAVKFWACQNGSLSETHDLIRI